MPAARLNGDTFIQLEVHCCEELPRNTDEATTAEGGRGGHATEPARLRGGRAPCAMIGRKTGAPVGEGSARSERGVQRRAGGFPGWLPRHFVSEFLDTKACYGGGRDVTASRSKL